MTSKSLLSLVMLCALLWGCANNPTEGTAEAFSLEQMRIYRKPLQEQVDILPDSAKQAFIDSLQKLTVNNPVKELAIMRVISQYYYHQREYGEALHWVNRELAHLKRVDTLGTLYDDFYFRKGDIFFDLQQFQLAFKEYLKGLELAQNQNDSEVQANFNHRLGQLSYRKKDFAKALDYYQKSLQLFNQINDERLQVKYRRQEICSNIGLCYWRLGQRDKSIAWFDSALVYIERVPHRVPHEILMYKVAREVTLGNQGMVKYELGDRVRGLQQMKKAMAFNSMPNADPGHAAYMAHQIAQVLIGENKLNEAKRYIDTAKVILGKQPYTLATLFQEKTYINYFLKTGKLDSLSVHLNAYMTINDSLKNTERSLAAVNADQLMAGLEKDFALRSEMEKSKAQLRLNSILIAMIGSLLAGLSVIVWLWQKGNRKNRMLASLNKHISEQNALLEKAQIAQIETNDRLEQLNRQKDKLLRVVAHDLRNPLAAIFGLSGILLEEKDKAHDREFLELANQACRGGLDLIGELLDQKGEKTSRDIFVRRERMPAKQFLHDTLRLLKHRAEEKNIELVLNCQYDGMLYIDIERLRRAITNLVVNAIKFSPRGQKVALSCSNEQDRVVFEVRDFGIGIPADHLPRLFESFTQTKRTGTEGEKPFGLGLSITKQIAEEHNGAIQVESTVGVGSVFRLVIPATLPENN